LKRWRNESSSKCDKCSNDSGGDSREMPVGRETFDVEPVFWSEMLQMFGFKIQNIKKVVENVFYESVERNGMVRVDAYFVRFSI
jgi:hypothetical protein